VHGRWLDIENSDLNREKTDDQGSEIVGPIAEAIENKNLPIIAIAKRGGVVQASGIVPDKRGRMHRPVNQANQSDDNCRA
jgi:hypothetical protein